MALFIGLDLGGTNLKYALGSENGDILIKRSRPSNADQSQEAIFETMFASIEELLSEANDQNEKVMAIGVGSPGSIDIHEGKLLGSTPNIQAWTNAPIKKKLEERFSIPVWADNDANIMALAEARKGAGRGFNNILCLTLGTGIGGGIVINGEVLRGSHFSAAEVGHVIIDYKGKLCKCGNRGCFEVYASATAMVERYQQKLKAAGISFNPGEIDAKLIFERAAKKEIQAIETINETCQFLSIGIVSIANIIDPEVVVIGGGISEAGDDFIRQTEKMVKNFGIKSITQSIKLVRAQMGNDAGIIGAILLAAENFNKKL